MTQIFASTKPTASHQIELMKWFSNERDLIQWGGPKFRLPYNSESFAEDLFQSGYTSLSLVNDKDQLVAFGQYYLLFDRCHLCRLAVSPTSRGKGIVKTLINELHHDGVTRFKMRQASLFVYEENQRAIKAYEKYGFEISEYPNGKPMEKCLYMTMIPN